MRRWPLSDLHIQALWIMRAADHGEALSCSFNSLVLDEDNIGHSHGNPVGSAGTVLSIWANSFPHASSKPWPWSCDLIQLAPFTEYGYKQSDRWRCYLKAFTEESKKKGQELAPQQPQKPTLKDPLLKSWETHTEPPKTRMEGGKCSLSLQLSCPKTFLIALSFSGFLFYFGSTASLYTV